MNELEGGNTVSLNEANSIRPFSQLTASESVDCVYVIILHILPLKCCTYLFKASGSMLGGDHWSLPNMRCFPYVFEVSPL